MHMREWVGLVRYQPMMVSHARQLKVRRFEVLAHPLSCNWLLSAVLVYFTALCGHVMASPRLDALVCNGLRRLTMMCT